MYLAYDLLIALGYVALGFLITLFFLWRLARVESLSDIIEELEPPEEHHEAPDMEEGGIVPLAMIAIIGIVGFALFPSVVKISDQVNQTITQEFNTVLGVMNYLPLLIIIPIMVVVARGVYDI